MGLLVVQVVGARDLKKMDAFGKADPFVELSTQPTHTVKTVRPETLKTKGSFHVHALLRA